MSADSFRFQVDLRAIIRVLSESLYSTPRVFVRELLQNGTDAINARRSLGDTFEPRIRFELDRAGRETPPTLTVTDTGVGLTEEEIHQFLATIGSSSKRLEDGRASQDFIGAFGIGLLSCFMVADEIVLMTRSARPGSPSLEWRGKFDGTYAIRKIADLPQPGTQVILRAKPDAAELFESRRLQETIHYYGAMLPFPVEYASDKQKRQINGDSRPWKQKFSSASARRTALLDHGKSVFGERFLDAIELSGDGLEGVAYVMARMPAPSHRPTHRLYLKGMLLTEKGEGVMPEWAFFVRAILNTTRLSPSASRESFREDEKLEDVRESISDSLRAYLFDLAGEDPAQLKKIVALHLTAIKALAGGDDEALRAFAGVIPFETTLGRLTLTELSERCESIRYVRTVDEFRQIASVMAAQDQCVINAGYAHDQEVIERFAALSPKLDVSLVESTELVQSLQPLSAEEEARGKAFVAAAARALKRHECEALLRRFEPVELAALYTVDDRERFRRNLDRTAQSSDALWSDVLAGLDESVEGEGAASLCFNFDNPLIQRAIAIRDGSVQSRMIEMLYVHALLLGHHPLGPEEMKLLNRGLIDLIELAMKGEA